jgi:ribosomal protein L13E
MKNQAAPPLPPGDTLAAAKSRVTTARNNFERIKEEVIRNLGEDFVDWPLLESSPDQFDANKIPLVVRAVTAAQELLAAEGEAKLADEAVVAVHEASTPATIADLKDIIGAIQLLGTRMDNRMDEISGRVDEIAEQTNGLRKSIQQDLVTTGRTIHQHVAKELQQHKAGQGAYSLAELKELGVDCGVLRSSGHTAQQLKELGFSAQQLKEAGFSAQQLKEAGFSAQQLKEVGFSAQQLKEAGFSAQQLKQGGYEDAEIGGAGYQVTELAAAGIGSYFWGRASPDTTLSEEGLVATKNGSGWKPVFGDVQLTKGTHYVEVQLVTLVLMVGVAKPGLDVGKSHYSGNDAYCLYMASGGLYGSGKSDSDKAGAFAQGDRVGVLVNLDDGSLLFFKNGQKHGPGYGAGSVKGPVVLMAEFATAGDSIKLLTGAARPAGY